MRYILARGVYEPHPVQQFEFLPRRLSSRQGRDAEPLNSVIAIPIVRNGHAAVFDGLAHDASRLLAHVNFGWGGTSDGWYDFAKLAEERELLYVIRVAP